MSDLIKYLRDDDCDFDMIHRGKIADEIARLTKQRYELIEALKKIADHDHCDDDARAGIAYEALEVILKEK
jgi:uncharacterized membrane-anchored protein